MSKPLLIIKCGEKLPALQDVQGDYENWILESMQWNRNSIICSVYKDEALPDVNSISAIVITGSDVMVTDDLPWIHSTIDWLQSAFDTSIPILGICFGHQLLAQALGGIVIDNPIGVEVGTVSMRVIENNDVLFSIFPELLNVQVSHQQAVIKLPEGVKRLATTDMDANHAFRYGKSVWGIQFHPEFNKAIVEKYIDFYQEIAGEGLKDNPANNAVESTKILQQFTKQIR